MIMYRIREISEGVVMNSQISYSFVHALQCRYLLTDADNKASSSDQCRKAVLYGIPVLSLDFLTDSVSSGHALALEPYIVLPKPKGIIVSLL